MAGMIRKNAKPAAAGGGIVLVIIAIIESILNSGLLDLF